MFIVAAAAFPAAATAQTIAITGGKVFPVSGPPIEHGTVLITNGKVTAVGTAVPIPAGATRVDATGKWVTPGLLNAATQLGLMEGGGPEFSGGYNDTRAAGKDGIAASFNAFEGINPASTWIVPTWQDGTTTVGVWPGGNFIGGRGAVVDLTGATLGQMLVKAPAAMYASLADPAAAHLSSRGELFGHFRNLLLDVKSYAARKVAYENNGTRAFAAPRSELEALIPAVNGTLPLIVEVDRASDIRAVLALAREFNLRIVLASVTEGWLVAEDIARAKVPVFVGAMNNIPGSFSSLGMRQENAGLLRAAGVSVSLIGNAGGGDEEAFNARNVRYEAGNAVAYGMTWDDALRAVTLAPAEALGVADRVGSLQAGREANVVIWNGDPFEFATRAERVFIRGTEMKGTSRQEELTARYRRP
jgi:imidazolonepropionase-like amidohydrolase